MMHYGFGHFGGGIYMILFWILLIVGIIYLISRSQHGFFGNNHRRDYRSSHKEKPHKSEYYREDSKRFEGRKYRTDDIDRTKSPQEIAKQRYAKGEINKEEYKEILKEINR